MKQQQPTMIKLCDELTKDGKNLVITWNGGNDEGYFEILLDEEPLDDEIDFGPIEDYISKALGYGSFAGDFSTTGELTYNRETKSFDGIDNYSTSESDNYMCTINVTVPDNIWFDQLDIFIEMESDEEEPNVAPSFIIANGPRIDHHTEIENKIGEMIKKQVMEVQEGIPNFNSLYENITIAHREFIKRSNKLVFVIKKIEYSYDGCRENIIHIQLPEN
ncbi:hypothetical protein [Niastella vici]|nr:hypothetical protein [Niastella vici]